ncbi:MAG TPA: hypothetical protein PLZ45_13820 [Ferruginibacter sp.]|nr:hypothetical protein [Ferruginibacter sp.]
MKQVPCIAFCISLIVLSCTHREKNHDFTPDTPKALKEESSSSGILTKKRYEDDLVETLYGELMEKDPQLKQLEKTAIDLDNQRIDSAMEFNAFDNKNSQYYRAGDQHLQRIQDSVLGQRIRAILDNSLAAYRSSSQYHKNLIETLTAKNLKLDDLRTALKIVKTIPLIEKFQKENLPSAKPLEKVNNRFDKAIEKADSLMNK